VKAPGIADLKRTADEVLSLLDEHGARLHALLLRLTLRREVAEDLMQDLFCKLVESPHFRAANCPLAYAIRMATNLAFDHRRNERRDAKLGAARLETNTAQPPAVIARQSSPLAQLVRQEELEQTLDAIGQLAPAAREIIVLRYLEREDFEQIAQQIGKSPHQARALCHKAITRLRIVLNQERASGTVPRRPTV
jgi:RNA polymerase sigma-70 factor (ECF subfamily)